MNSSMVAGERRWASARRGGMTVLGKVAVPKPLNLPSQRLENHGLDPTVEIVPKGTLSWGSRPSSSGSNPWISSSLSPNAEGGTVSPSHLSGLPSSGGSGTRPSTAGSESTHEPVANTWGSNSRPSSASGTLSSNQASSTSLRPRSAENRPNSSQLSRFADPVPKSSAAWGSSGTAERLGVKSSKDGFSLSSGDFPTLGTEKDNSTKNTDLEDHVRPSSASGRISHGQDDTRPQADVKHGTVNTWRADGPRSAEDDIHPSMEKWNRDNPQQYFNPHTAPQHFDAWRGPPMNGPAGVWYGGQRPRGPPFGAPVRPGGFPMEPFPYYRPQIAPPPLAGPQPGPPPGPRGPHSKNGDLYRPQMPDAYARPGMPFRPGFYPGPPGPMAFEGYYGPPMGYERDIPYMGMPAGPPVYNNSSYPGPAPDMGNSHGRNGRGHHAGKSSEQVEVDDTQGPKKLTLKNRNQCDQREEGENREHNVQQPDVPYPEKNRLPLIISRKKEWGTEEDTDEALYAKRGPPGEKSPRDYGYRVHSADGVEVKSSFEGTGNVKAVDDNWTSVPPEMPRVPLGSERDSSLPGATKNSDLMHKIDALNAKMRVSDGPNDSFSVCNREGIKNGSQIYDMKVNNNTGEVGNNVGYRERTPDSRDFVSVPHEVIVPVSDKPIQPMIAVSRRPHHGGQGRVDHRGKGKLNSQDAVGWQQRPLTAESSSAITPSHNESAPNSYAHGHNNIEEASENSVINPVGKIEGDSVETHDSSDIQAQRSKMREIAKQRALQLQKEEEERTREQRAKALAKLEELNRRALAGETESEKSEKSKVSNEIPPEKDESRTSDEPVVAEHNNTNQAVESVEIPKNLPVESDVSTLPVHEDVRDDSVRKVASQFNDSRHRRTGYKQKQNNSFQKSFTEKPSESNMPNSSGNVVEPPVSQRRKNNRSGKNKHKYDETTPLPPVTPDVNPRNESVERIEAKDSLSSWESSFSTIIEPDRTIRAQEVICSSLPNEESHDKWKPHPSRRLPRNQQGNNKLHSNDTAVWAPVSKAKDLVDASPNTTTQNNLKGKRAEMERYVPKPVAKELAQQVNDVSSEEVVIEVDIGHNKHRRAWRQRGPPDSTKEIQQSIEIGQFVKSEIDSVNAGDGYNNNISNNTNAANNKTIGSKENRAASHWQPKSSSNTANNQHVDKTETSSTDTNRFPRNEHPSRRKAQGGNFSRTQPGQEFEKKAKGRLYSQNQDHPVGPGELSPAADEDVRVEHNVSSGYRRNGRQNDRSIRGRDNNTARGDWTSGHDNRPHNGPPFRDNRQRQNLHYEYQPAGPFKGNRPERVEEGNEGGDGTDGRYRERGQSRSRRGGNFNRRQSGPPAVVDSGWE